MKKTLIVLAAVVLAAAASAPVAASPAGEPAEGHLMVGPDELEWNPVGSMPAGATAAVLEGDPGSEDDFTMRIRFPADYVIPLHTHPAVERVTVLEGTLYFAVGDTFDRSQAEALPPGALAVMEPGVPMYGFTEDEPVVIQLNSRGPWGIQYVNPEEDPRQ